VKESVRITVQKIIHEGENAMLVDVDGDEVWIPLSQIDEIHRDELPFPQLVVTRWIAKQKGLV